MKTKTPRFNVGPTTGLMGLTTYPTAYYYTPHFPESQLVALYDHALSREHFHRIAALAGAGDQHRALQAKHRRIRLYLGEYIASRGAHR